MDPAAQELHPKADPAFFLTHILTLDSKGWRLIGYSWMLFSSSMESWWLREREGNEFNIFQSEIPVNEFHNLKDKEELLKGVAVFGGSYLDLCVQFPTKNGNLDPVNKKKHKTNQTNLTDIPAKLTSIPMATLEKLQSYCSKNSL